MQTSRSQLDDARRAVRTDAETGIREVAEFFGPHRLKMFGCRHLPLGFPRHGVVICSPLQAEFVRNYRREVNLGHTLAAAGFAVQRFHYRGTGNSGGATSDATFGTMRDDTMAAAAWLRSSQSLDTVSFVGTRWSSLVAAAAAARFPGAPLVLWDPVLDAARYFRDVFRTVRIQELKAGEPNPRSAEELTKELDRAGTLDVLGYSIDRPLYDDAIARSLEGELGDVPRPILIVQISRTNQLRGDYQALAERWTERRFQVSTLTIPYPEEAWWFPGGRGYEEERALTGELATRTSDWITSACVASARSS